ncbi:MAG: redox-sensing transcriptional repressor Rex [Clostridia bacterium]|nr:redox-sensing transcriptional repressor Rex [Clostridia bacterium]MBR0510537.1 redox-sensing transcriptional repressor Rex [Clostridia bacterium]MBR0537283.1 redox-sensing transcriptional repressor Rex [Clostridia bacterium]
MKEPKEISASVVNRLPRYYRFICEEYNNGTTRISSKELSQKMGLTASQIRQDFNCFGGFGQQGYGYNVEQLKNELAQILGLTTLKDCILIGAGNLGRTVAGQMNFEELGFRLRAVFDADKAFEGLKIRGIPILLDTALGDYCAEHRPEMAILCIPVEQAPKIVDTLILYGVDSFWNFSHYDIHRRYPGTKVQNVHLRDSLMTLSYILTN